LDSCVAQELKSRIEENDEKPGGDATGCMISGFAFGLEEERTSAELVSKGRCQSACLSIALNPDIDSRPAGDGRFLQGEGLDRMEGGNRRAFFLKRSQDTGGEEAARMEDRFPRPRNPGLGQALGDEGDFFVGEAEKKDIGQPGCPGVIDEGGALPDDASTLAG